VLAYIAGLPVVFLGMLGTVVMMQLMNQLATAALPLADVPAHPIVELFARGALAEKLQAVAVVLLVPITEEIMFRGAMYRHLREASGRGGIVLSVLFSLFFSSFLFAVIHPQGPAGVPLLMSIAIVLAVVREWRESLVSPIVTHMVVNGVTTSLALLAFS
ncbi:MAG: lysostaphin resistance A-like protein, partial [Planctomycetaceae bacterium]